MSVKNLIALLVIAAIIFWIINDSEPENGTPITGVVTKIYEVPTFKAYSIAHHIVIRDLSGVGHDINVDKDEAAQYAVGDTITINE